MPETMRTGRWTVAGRYELMGVNGSLLPAPLDDGTDGTPGAIRSSVVAGELRLDPDGGYRLIVTAEFETDGGARYTRVLTSTGAWRFLASALDPTSGEVQLSPPVGAVTSAAVTGISLVHRTRAPGSSGPTASNWIYVRHWQTP